MEEEFGLIEGHAYGILDVRELDSGATRLVQLRNPWGVGAEWRGKWCDADASSWTEERRAQLRYDGKADDGVFWMAFTDLTQTFCGVCWLHLVDGWSTTLSEPFILPGADNMGRPILQVTVSEATRAIVTLHLPDKRTKEDKYSGEAYGGCRLEVIRLGHAAAAAATRHVASTVPVRQRDVSTAPLDLEPGEYLVICWATFPQGVHRQCVASVYSSAAVTLQPPSAAISKPEIVHELLANAHMELVRREGQPVPVSAEVAAAGVTVTSLRHHGGCLLLVDHSCGSPAKICVATVDVQMTNGAFLPPDAGMRPGRLRATVHAGETRLVRAQPDRVGEGWSYGYGVVVQLTRDWESAATLPALHAEAKHEGKHYDYGASGGPRIEQWLHQFESGVAMAFENNEVGKVLELQLDFQLGNLRLEPPRGQAALAELRLAPGSRELLVMRKIDAASGFSFGYSSASRIMTT